MAKATFAHDGKWYFFDDDSGIIYEIKQERQITPSPELIKAAFNAMLSLKPAGKNTDENDASRS